MDAARKVDLLAERIAARRETARLRAEALRARLPEAAARLRTFGATRVVLFGSLARPGAERPQSDVDLAVWGLPADAYFRAGAEISELLGVTVDLVSMETAPASVVARVAADGIDVPVGHVSE